MAFNALLAARNQPDNVSEIVGPVLEERKRRKLQPVGNPMDEDLIADIAACEPETASYRIGRYYLRRIPCPDNAGDEAELEVEYFCGTEMIVWQGPWPKDL